MARVALVASSFVPRIGGVEEHVRHAAAELRRAGHEVVVWAVDQSDDVPDQVDGIRVRYLPCPLPSRTVPALLRWASSIPRAWAAWEAARRADRPEIIHIHCYGPNGVYASQLARLHRLALVYSHHGETFMDANAVFETSALLRRSLRATLRQAGAVTSCSAFAAADLARFGYSAAAVQVVYNGVDLDEPVGALPAGLPARYVAGIGRLVANKGFDSLVRAFAMLVDADLDGVDLVIAGTGPERDPLATLAAQLGVAERVHLVGALARPEVGSVLQAAELLVVPSRIEAFGITVLEGWRAGVPVLATRRGGPAEFVEDGRTGLLVDPEDPSSIADAMRRVLADPLLSSQLAGAGRASVAEFTWGAVAGAYSAIYCRLRG